MDDLERCPGCGNVIVRENGEVIGRNFCWPIEVNTSQVGYTYLANTWGYCYTLHRHYLNTEPVWPSTESDEEWDGKIPCECPYDCSGCHRECCG